MNILQIQKSAAATLLGKILLGFATTGMAASDIHFGPSGSEASASNPDGTWISMWGPAHVRTTFDSANPPPSGDTAGSVNVQNQWAGSNGDTYNMISPGTWWGAVTFDGTAYASIEMDIKYDTTSTITPASAAHLSIGFDTGYNQVSVTNVSFNTNSAVIANGAWHQLLPMESRWNLRHHEFLDGERRARGKSCADPAADPESSDESHAGLERVCKHGR